MPKIVGTIFDAMIGNPANRLTTLTDNASQQITFSYDNVDRLTSVTDAVNGNESFSFDAEGNRTGSHLSSSYSYQPFNRMTGTSTASMQYDANGNMIQRSEGGKFWRYGFDYENRLVEAAGRKEKVRYRYDALGRRVASVAGKRGNTKYTHDGLDVVMDDDTVLGVTKYQNGLGIDNKLSSVNGTNHRYFIADHLGSTNALTDAVGAVTVSTSYDSFGNPTNSSFPSRYQFTGREYDSFSGLQYSRARFYDPKLGRFISEDPIGFGGSDINLYGYVWNDPMHYIDPLGLDGWGNDAADWMDEKIELARQWYQPDPHAVNWNTGVNFVANLSFGASDAFRVGSGTGYAIYCDDIPDYRRLELVADDVLRAGGIALVLAGPIRGPAKTGKEYNFGGIRIAPFGNRTNPPHRTGKWPHYHRQRKDSKGRIKRDQGKGRHRPWDKGTTDSSFWDRF